MADYFELLHQPRRPWIDPDKLKKQFLAHSSEVHPDKVHAGSADEKQRAQQCYTDLNSAYQTLRQTKDRLAHLLELETGKKPAAVQNAPTELMDLFLKTGTLIREVDKFLEQKRATQSPLLRVSLFERGQQLSEQLTELQQLLNTQHEAAEKSLRDLDRDWAAGITSEALVRLEEIYRRFSYLSRWAAQVQERFVQLAL